MRRTIRCSLKASNSLITGSRKDDPDTGTTAVCAPAVLVATTVAATTIGFLCTQRAPSPAHAALALATTTRRRCAHAHCHSARYPSDGRGIQPNVDCLLPFALCPNAAALVGYLVRPRTAIHRGSTECGR